MVHRVATIQESGRFRSSSFPAAHLVCLGLLGAGLLGGGPVTADQKLTREVKRTFEIEKQVRVENLVGRLTATVAPGGASTITATVHAAGKDEKEAQELLDALDLRFVEEKGRLRVEAHYPLDRYDTYRYNPDGKRGTSTTRSSVDGKPVTITTGDAKDAVALWVDFDLALASGVGLSAKQLAGAIDVTAVEGPVAVETGSPEFLGSQG